MVSNFRLCCLYGYVNQFFSNAHKTVTLNDLHSLSLNFLNSIHVRSKLQTKQISAMVDLLSPPSQVRGMKELDRTQFDKVITIARLKLASPKISDVLPHVKKYVLKMARLKPVFYQDEYCIVLLNPTVVLHWNDIDQIDQKALNELKITEINLETHRLGLTYENFMADEIFRSVLPADQEGMSSFTKMGHIVHVNLREHLLEYKKLIGQVLLDKTSACRTVVNKVNEIDNTYRNFKMEVLAGANDLLTEVKENKCRFAFDFATVYWNSRLCTEHKRIVKRIGSGDVLFDVFAGVGPFSIPAAKSKCVVYANDLNPESYRWLNHNAQLNKVDGNYLKTFNKDGHEFIKTDVKENLLKHINTRNVHITMNLPALAVEFLSSLLGLYGHDELEEVTNPPVVYVYCFAKGEDYVNITKELVFKSVGRDISDKIVDIFRVRTVSSLKEMMRVTFKFDADLLLKKSTTKRKSDEDEDTENIKRSA